MCSNNSVATQGIEAAQLECIALSASNTRYRGQSAGVWKIKSVSDTWYRGLSAGVYSERSVSDTRYND